MRAHTRRVRKTNYLLKTVGLVVGIVIGSAYWGNSHAAFVSRGGGFSALHSYSAPARSYSATRAYAAPRTVYRSNTTIIHSSPAVVHHDSGHGFFTGMLLGNMLSHPAPVVVQQPVMAASSPMAVAAPVAPLVTDQNGYVVQQQQSVNWFGWFVCMFLAMFIGFPILLWFFRRG